MKHILLFGQNSFLAKSLLRTFARRGYTCTATDRKSTNDLAVSFDFSQPNYELDIFKQDFDYVIICASATSQSFCAEFPDISEQVNISTPIEIARHFSRRGVPTMVFSSDYVFSQNQASIKCNAEFSPEGIYGTQKSMLEKAFVREELHGAICRFSKILSFDTALIKNWVEHLHDDKPIEAFHDYFCSPIALEHPVAMILKIIEEQREGVFQLSNTAAISYYDLALLISKQIGRDVKLVKKVSFEDKFHKTVRSRSYLTLENSDLFNEIGIDPISVNGVIRQITPN